MLEGIHFYYDGVYSVDMGLLNCTIDGGMFEETFLPTMEIVETKVAGRDKPYYQSTELEPLEFELTFAFEHGYDERKIREVAKLFFQPYYKPFYTVDNPNRIFYCKPNGDSKLIHNGAKQGYITLTMRCESPYSYTQKVTTHPMKFNGTKVTKTINENTFSSGTGTITNMQIVGGKLQLSPPVNTWRSLSGKNWRDL